MKCISLFFCGMQNNRQDSESYWAYTLSLNVAEAAYYELRTSAKDYLLGSLFIKLLILREIDACIQGSMIG